MPLAPRRSQLRSWLALAGLLAVLAASSTPARAVLTFGPGNGVPPGYAPKDFTILQRDGVFHAFYILFNPALRASGNLGMHLNETRFGHAVSTDLATWTFVDSNFSVSTGGFDRHHVWAPTLLWADGRYWLFYTGVQDSFANGVWLPRKQQIGLAWTNDFNYWGRRSSPTLRCGNPDTPWANCSEGGLRDPFVMEADTSATGSGWFMYFITQPSSVPPGGYYDPLAFLVGTASGHAGDMTYWQNFGPNWSTYRSYQNVPNETTNKVESPHLFKHNGLWYLFFTGDLGLAYLTGSTPVGDTPVPQGEWIYRGCFDEVWSSEFASESFRATWADGTTEHYFGTVQGLVNYSSQINLRILNPTPGGRLLADPLMLTQIVPFAGGITEGDTLRLWAESEVPTAALTVHQTITRPMPLEVWERDDSLGVDRWTRLDPAAIGVPTVPKVTTNFGELDYGDTLAFTPHWVLDDDATPNCLEIQIRFRGVSSPVVNLWRSGYGVTGVGDEEDRRPLALRVGGATRAEASFTLDLPHRLPARLDLYDVRGRRIRTLVDRVIEAGSTTVAWDRRDDHGELVPPGVTFALLRAGGESARARVLTLH